MTIAMGKGPDIAMAGSPGSGIEEALGKAQMLVTDCRRRLEQAIARRDELVVDAIDLHQLSWRQTAKAAGLQLGAVHRILVDAGNRKEAS